MEKKIFVVDAENSPAGRVASIVAKKLLNSKEEIAVVNSEKAIITGNKHQIKERFMQRRNRLGGILRGPHISRVPDRLLKRMIRGMLPRKKERGQEALKRVKCYVGLPKEFQNMKALKMEDKTDLKYIALGEVYK